MYTQSLPAVPRQSVLLPPKNASGQSGAMLTPANPRTRYTRTRQIPSNFIHISSSPAVTIYRLHRSVASISQHHIPLKPFSKKEDKPGFSLMSSIEFPCTVARILQPSSSHGEAPQIILTADLVHHDDLRCHRADQHHSSALGQASSTSVRQPTSFCGILIAGGNLRTLIHHHRPSAPHFSTMLLPHLHHFSSFIFMSCTCLRQFKAPVKRAPILSSSPSRHHPDQIRRSVCFPHLGGAIRKRHSGYFPSLDPSKSTVFCCTSYHLMRNGHFKKVIG